MESHARTVDITTHSYYDLLYAFHVFRGNYRKGMNTKWHALQDSDFNNNLFSNN